MIRIVARPQGKVALRQVCGAGVPPAVLCPNLLGSRDGRTTIVPRLGGEPAKSNVFLLPLFLLPRKPDPGLSGHAKIGPWILLVQDRKIESNSTMLGPWFVSRVVVSLLEAEGGNPG